MKSKVVTGIDFGGKDFSVMTLVKCFKNGTKKIIHSEKIPQYTQIMSGEVLLCPRRPGKSRFDLIAKRWTFYQQIMYLNMEAAMGIPPKDFLFRLRSLRAKIGHITRKLNKNYGTL